MPVYTQDWFSWAEPLLLEIKPLLPARQRILELGAFEGRSSIWMRDNILDPGGILYAVDTWEGGEDHAGMDFSSVFDRFFANINENAPKDREIAHKQTTTVDALSEFIRDKYKFDLVYIDASHTAPDVMVDACMAWQVLKPQGVMVFDDYLWGTPRDVLHRPRIAIDFFTTLNAEALDIIHVGYQYAVRRK